MSGSHASVASGSCIVYKAVIVHCTGAGMTELDASVQAGNPLEASLAGAAAAYARSNPESARRYQNASMVMPGGNTRSVLYYPPFPLCIVRGDGCALWDADGHRTTT